jgi:hypothetical protein
MRPVVPMRTDPSRTFMRADCGSPGMPWTRPGVKKPHVRKVLPRQEQIAQIVARRPASKLPREERYRSKWMAWR